MYFFSRFLAEITSAGSALFEPLKSRWWAPLGITMATTESDCDFNTPPDDQGSNRPLLKKNESHTIQLVLLSQRKMPTLQLPI